MSRIGKLPIILPSSVTIDVQKGNQVMVFVHARSGTRKTIEAFIEILSREPGARSEFEPDQAHPRYAEFAKRVQKCGSKDVAHFFKWGFGIHHAGMLRYVLRFLTQLIRHKIGPNLGY